MRTSLKDLLRNTFSAEQMDQIPGFLLNKKFELEEVNNISSYVNECVAETKNFKVAGKHRLNDWEKGWSGDGVYYSDDVEINNIPYYFKNNTHIRVGNRVYKDITGFSEVMLLRALQSVVMGVYLKRFNIKSMIEYGCGTGSNISFLQQLYPDLCFYGADWAQSACEKLVENNIVEAGRAIRVDYFDSSTFQAPCEESLAFTNASLEQTGLDYAEFMHYLFECPNIIAGIHIEPIRDLLDLNNELNQQSFDYAERRGYLTEFMDFIRSESSIEVLEARDYGLGSKYISGYQVVVWGKK